MKQLLIIGLLTFNIAYAAGLPPPVFQMSPGIDLRGMCGQHPGACQSAPTAVPNARAAAATKCTEGVLEQQVTVNGVVQADGSGHELWRPVFDSNGHHVGC